MCLLLSHSCASGEGGGGQAPLATPSDKQMIGDKGLFPDDLNRRSSWREVGHLAT